MQRLWPESGNVDDLGALVAAEVRSAPADRPWVLVNMISSLDGAISIDGRSGGLGRPADKAMFSALRAVADVVLVGAGTARAEGYGPPRPSESTRAERVARGQAAAPRLALVTRSLDLDLTTPLFTEAEQPPFVIAPTRSDAARLAEVGAVAELVLTGGEQVDLPASLAALRAAGVAVVTCEGGPRLNGDLVDHDLVDEWALTLSPLLVGGEAPRSVVGAPPNVHPWTLDRLLEGDGLLLGRWLRAR